MKWAEWVLKRFGWDQHSQEAERAVREQEAKLRELRARAPEVRREVNRFAADIEAAMARRRQQ